MSSYQLEDEERGFNFRSYCNESSLDMRFDSSPYTNFAAASDIVNNSSKLELIEIFKRFGDERYPERLADQIIKARPGTIISTTGELKEAINEAFNQSGKKERDDTIKRAFQALRIAVNQELLNLQKFLEDCPSKFLDT